LSGFFTAHRLQRQKNMKKQARSSLARIMHAISLVRIIRTNRETAMKAKILRWVAVGLLAVPFAAGAAPITTQIGNVTVGSDVYAVSLLYDSEGSDAGQTFDALNPTITFTDEASGLAAAQALLDTFGATFDWNPASPVRNALGVRVVFAVTATEYSFFAINNFTLPSLAGPFDRSRDAANVFSFAQFELVGGPASVPEPTTLALLGLGLVGIGLRRRAAKATS
jgi:hypothetical protein